MKEITGIKRDIFFLLIIATLSYLLFFYNLGAWDLWGFDETRYAQVPKEMMEKEGWFLLHYNGEIYSDKPPLYFWFTVLSYKTFGEITSFSARFPTAFAGALSLFVVYLIARMLFNPSVAFLSSIILSTTPLYLHLSRENHLDTTLLLFELLSIVFFIKVSLKGNKKTFFIILGYFFMGLGILTKGPVAIVISFLVIISYSITFKEFERLKILLNPFGWLILILVVGAWLVPACLMGGKEYTIDILFRQSFGRVTKYLGGSRPFYYFILNFPAWFLPWTLFLPGAAIFSFTKKENNKQRLIFLFLWVILVLLFFSISKSKRDLYMLPSFPAAAIIVGFFLEKYIAGKLSYYFTKFIEIPLWILVWIGISASLIFPALLFAKKGIIAGYPIPYKISLPFSGIIFIGSFAIGILVSLKKTKGVFYALILFIVISVLYASQFIYPYFNQYKSAKPFCKQITHFLKPKDELLIYGGFEPSPFNFYTGYSNIKIIRDKKSLCKILSLPKRYIVIMENDSYKEFTKAPCAKIYLLSTGMVGSRNLVVISNKPSIKKN
ncbi:MAG: glycosyltransferase family 39 protein [Deltaproteobacteria bacterium]|nr:glycosyltransferase family 39 protein [Deltaproteobacteria bacterium]